MSARLHPCNHERVHQNHPEEQEQGEILIDLVALRCRECLNAWVLAYGFDTLFRFYSHVQVINVLKNELIQDQNKSQLMLYLLKNHKTDGLIAMMEAWNDASEMLIPVDNVVTNASLSSFSYPYISVFRYAMWLEYYDMCNAIVKFEYYQERAKQQAPVPIRDFMEALQSSKLPIFILQTMFGNFTKGKSMSRVYQFVLDVAETQKALTRMLILNPDLIENPYHPEDTFLMNAVGRENISKEVFELIVIKSRPIIDATTSLNLTALHLACHRTSIDKMITLIKNGANANLPISTVENTNRFMNDDLRQRIASLIGRTIHKKVDVDTFRKIAMLLSQRDPKNPPAVSMFWLGNLFHQAEPHMHTLWFKQHIVRVCQIISMSGMTKSTVILISLLISVLFQSEVNLELKKLITRGGYLLNILAINPVPGVDVNHRYLKDGAKYKFWPAVKSYLSPSTYFNITDTVPPLQHLCKLHTRSQILPLWNIDNPDDNLNICNIAKILNLKEEVVRIAVGDEYLETPETPRVRWTNSVKFDDLLTVKKEPIQ